VSPTKAGLGSLVTKTSVSGCAKSNAVGTEQSTTTQKKNTKPKATSKKKASVNQNTDSKPPGEKEKKATKPRRSNKPKPTSKEDNAVVDELFTEDFSDVVLLSEHDNNTSQDDVSAVLHNEYLEAEETSIPHERDECFDVEETPIPNDNDNDFISDVGMEETPIPNDHDNDRIADVGVEERPIPNNHDNDCISDVRMNSFSPLCSYDSNNEASGIPAPKKKARKRKGIAKENMTMTKQVHVHQKKSNAVNEPVDDYVGHVAAFFMASPGADALVKSFGKKWTTDAICFTLDSSHGHIIGKVLRHSKNRGSISYDVAWECSTFGESLVNVTLVRDACIAGRRLLALRANCPIVTNTAKRCGRPAGSSKKIELRGVLTSLKNASDDDGYGSAPSIGSDVSACVEQLEDGDGSTSEVDSSDEAGNVMDLLFGNPFSDTEEDDVSAGVPTLLHWENGTSIDTEPAKKMAETPSTVNPEFQHLFGSPIDAVFAMLPYLFREIMAFEINKYAKQVLDNSDKNKIAGYQWKAVSVGEVITYFGILIFAMLYPQTGRRFQSSWKNPDLHPWTTAMCKYRFCRLLQHFILTTAKIRMDCKMIHYTK